VIEIETVNYHLLNECDKREQFRECGRCKESIHRDEYDMHTEEKACPISKPAKAAARCPMCHCDVVPAGEEGWRRHLLEEGCPENPRNKK
jgi:centrosomal protein CEP104